MPPKLLSASPADALLNVKPKKIVLRFDEYITTSDVSSEVQISPILAIPLTVSSKNKEVTVKLVDSLLEPNTTYRLTFGKAIKDLHEGNVFKNYNYIFSTGAYFDSLQFSGNVVNAATGLADTGKVIIVLYPANKPDSAVIREKPKYFTTVNGDGSFVFKGLPARSFKVYALKDLNSNLFYDAGDEQIAFITNVITPGDSSLQPLQFRLFKEIAPPKAPDTSALDAKSRFKTNSKPTKDKVLLNYTVSVDTSDAQKRTQELNKPIEVALSQPTAVFNKDRILLTKDSLGIAVNVSFALKLDTSKGYKLLLQPRWQDNTLYTLKLLKGFVKDTSGADVMPARFTFRTKREEDYSKLMVHLSGQYQGKKYLLLVNSATDTVHYKPILDTMVNLVLLKPDVYTLRIIIDDNGNGKWDTGDLFAKLQPEFVIPYSNTVTLKAGWDNVIDFVPDSAKTPKIFSDRKANYK